MFKYIAERKIMIIAVVLVVGFFFFAAQQRPNTSLSKSSFEQVNLESPMSKGVADAPVSLIQYSDFLCPSCSYFSTQVMPTISKDYIQTDKVKFEFRPMAFIAEGSQLAAEGAYCAIEQDMFWAYHDVTYIFVADSVFNKGLDPKVDVILTSELVKNNAKQAGLDQDAFDICLDSGSQTKKVTDATTTANRNGVTSTPYLLINGQKYQGDVSLSAVETIIKSQL
jgi:protein-disulfide isomerase